jgi:Tfp pilus assembly protein PilZ
MALFLEEGSYFFQYLSGFFSPCQFTMSLGKDVFLAQITQDFFDKIFIFLKINSINGLPI